MRHLERAAAKINLSLRVLGKREDGFHEIETLMALLDGVEDVLEFELKEGGGELLLECSDPELPTDGTNLVMKAARAFEEETGTSFEGRIRLKKSVPSGAGLGGGSADAAAVLRALNTLAGTGLGPERLQALAAGFGSDVPFFITGATAWCRGRGERIELSNESIPRTRLLLAKPAFGVASAWAYQQWASSQELASVDYAPQSAAWGSAVNDLERPVFEKYPILAELKGWLKEQPETSMAMMSGSGATVFAALEEGVDTAAIQERLLEMFGASTWTALAQIGGE